MIASLDEIFVREFPDAGDTFSADARLRDDLGLDSMDIVRLQIAIEDNLNFRFDPAIHDLTSIFTTIGAIDSFLADQNLTEGSNRA